MWLLLSFVLSVAIAAADVLPPLNSTSISPPLTYDYIIVGCGIAGLVVAMRISELPVSVLCIEAGPLDHDEALVEFPIDIGKDIGTLYDWNISTVPQTQLDGAARPVPMGRVVGGGSILNGMIWNRGNQDDFNAWAEFGNPGWSWSDLLPYFKKSETFTPRYYPACQDQPVQFNVSMHGFNGPVQVSYPDYYWNQSDNWFDALAELGVPIVPDPNSGLGAGGYFLPNDIDPINQTRSDARRTYYDPYSERSNFDLIANSQVTRVLFDVGSISSTIRNSSNNSLQAIAIEYAADAASPRQTAFANQEIIIAAGALHSPQILQLSGIGPADLLEQFNISVLQDLIGVGNNLQDHCMVNIDYDYQQPGLLTPYTFQSNATDYNTFSAQYLTSKTGPFTSFASTAVAFPSLPQITNSTASLLANANTTSPSLPSTYDPSLLAGYSLYLSSLLTRLANPATPAYEILNNNAGGLHIALQHPLSRGTVSLASADPFAAPLVDPRWLTHPLDTAIMLEAMQFNQRLVDTPALAALEPSYAHFPLDPNTTALTAYLVAHLKTEFHYAGSCAMMPRACGGVLAPDLRVYGTANLRVVDTSLFPTLPAAHPQAAAYAVAEKAADLIKRVNAIAISAAAAAGGAGPVDQAYLDWLVAALHLKGN